MSISSSKFTVVTKFQPLPSTTSANNILSDPPVSYHSSSVSHSSSPIVPPFTISSAQLCSLVEHKDRATYDALGGSLGIAQSLVVNPLTGLCPPIHYVSPNQVRIENQSHEINQSWYTSLPIIGSYFIRKHSLIRNDSNNICKESVSLLPPRTNTNSPTLHVNDQHSATGISQSISTVIQMDAGPPVAQGSTIEALDKRVQIFGENRLPDVEPKSILGLMWDALHDKTLIFLTCAALVSFSIGMYEDFGVHHDEKTEKIKWVEGVAIIIAVVIVVLVASVNDWQKERQFRALSKRADDRVVKVLRNSYTTLISVYDLLVGDVLCLEPGDILPADAIFLSGHGVSCDESAATGETDTIKKGFDKDVFLISGSKVQEGTGRCLVIVVGPNSFHGRTLMSMRMPNTDTPLQIKLNVLAESIAKLGGVAALLILTVLILKYLVTQGVHGGFDRNGPNWQSVPKIIESITQIIITTITVLVVAVPEGLPLAVTISLAFATKKMLADNNLVRVLASCEVMGNATTVCSDKTGTLTQNKMTVVKARLGLPSSSDVSENDMNHPDDAVRLSSLIPDTTLWTLINENIAINSSAFEDVDAKTNIRSFVGSKTETAMLDMQRKAGIDYATIRAQSSPIHVYPFSSANKWMGTVLDNLSDSTQARLHVKGASEIVLAHCSSVYQHGVGSQPLTPARLQHFLTLINEYASESLRTIALAYMDVEKDKLPQDLARSMPLVTTTGGEASMITSQELNSLFPNEDDVSSTQKIGSIRPDNTNEANIDDKINPKVRHTFSWAGNNSGPGLVLLGIIGIEDPIRPGVPEAVAQCQQAGVFVRMVTGDNVATARSIAQKCGILQRGGLVMEGRTFRKLPLDTMEKVIPRLQVLARSSPTDKQLLVERLKDMGDTVAVTGDGTNDGPALKLADVGFSMGIAGTEVAKEASSIILMDDNFASIVKAILWGRSVNDSVRKFLQFQLTVNITAVIVTFISAVSSDEQRSILTAVQLLWVNLIMDSLAALALATEPPTQDMLERLPDGKSAPLISYHMWKMISGQAFFQIIVNLIAIFIGPQVYPHNTESLNTFVFNTFIFMQIFNEINCRRLDKQLNTIEGIHRNPFFVGILILTVILQIILVQFGGSAFQTVPLSEGEWIVSIAIGFLSIPVGVIIRLAPDWLYRPPEDDRVVMTKRRLQWIGAISTVQTQLKVFHALHGSQRIQNSGLRASQAKVLSTSSSSSVLNSSSYISSPTSISIPSPKRHSKSSSISGHGRHPHHHSTSIRTDRNQYYTIDDDDGDESHTEN